MIFAAISLCVTSERVFVVVVYFVVASVRKLFDTPSYFASTIHANGLNSTKFVFKTGKLFLTSVFP